jgi:hypothetical protein
MRCENMTTPTDLEHGPDRGARDEASVRLSIGSQWRNEFGDLVHVVGPGIAGCPEVEMPDGTTYYEDPQRLVAA